MGEIVESLAIIQILSSIMILVPVIYWVLIKRVVVEDPPPMDQNLFLVFLFGHIQLYREQDLETE